MLGMVPISQAAHRALAPPAETVLPVQGMHMPITRPWPAGQLGPAVDKHTSLSSQLPALCCIRARRLGRCWGAGRSYHPWARAGGCC